MEKVVVLSLGGSLIIPDEVDYKFLREFKEVLLKVKDYKFVVVCGGGSIARKYINALKNETSDHKLLSMAGIGATRMNARFLSYFFGVDPDKGIPHDMKQVKNLLLKNRIIFCGALRYAQNETSDGTAAKLANFLNCDFINLTNVNGLYTDNPLTNKNAKFIPEISWKNFNERTNKMKFKPGQHFVLDQHAAEVIMKSRIKTYIIGPHMKNLENILKNKPFKGTTIAG